MNQRGRNPNHRSSKPEIVCLCNCVPREKIEEAIRGGAKTLNEIFDATGAGVGPCGGSCRRKLQPMLETYLGTGEFPEKLPDDKRDKRDKRCRK